MLQTRATLPSWAISVLLHALLLIGLGLTLRLARPRDAAAQRTAEVGIVLKDQSGGQEFYHSGGDVGGGDAGAAAAATGGLEALLDEQPPSDPGAVLPSSLAVIGPGALEGGGVGTARGADRGPRGNRTGLGGKATTGVFGVQGEGYKFVYVFDRSGSMGGSGRNPLSAAKAELRASLESLDKIHQFQIIFYNERPWRFNPAGQPNKLCFATEQNKTLAAKFIGGITADGGTRHEDALMAAIKLQPDVIFFLTDADEPKLWPGQLEKIRRRAAGITIHAIQFGFGSQTDPENFLVKLARDNNGKHGYVDISKLSPMRRP